ncbi:phosphatase 2C-like domain-containing protein [Spinellus fusiger]|nr:phosphatase 2C-like domain-containing protein [Spinellus fusiger]
MNEQSLPTEQTVSREKTRYTLLTPEDINKRLRTEQFVTLVQHDRVKAVHTSQLASNSPVEDNYSIHGSGNTLIAGVYDGHIGPECSRMIKRELPQYMARQLVSDQPTTPDKVRESLGVAFETLDHAIQQRFYDLFPKNINQTTEQHVKDAVLRHPDPAAADTYIREAITGSCACTVYLDGDDLYAANTGDSRVVVVRQEGDGTWTGRRLVEEQSPAHPEWKAHMLSQHPSEEALDIVKRKRVFGLIAVGGSFGDIMYKVPVPYQMKVFPYLPYDIYKTFARYHHRIVVHYHTPPYLSSKPLTTHYKLTPEDKFIIIGTDGLWDELSWDNVRSTEGDQMAATLITKAKEDNNLATHMIRQALLYDAAYKNTGQQGPVTDPTLEMSKRLTHTPSRSYRDDITITVIELGNRAKKEELQGVGEVVEGVPVDISQPPLYTKKAFSWFSGWGGSRL